MRWEWIATAIVGLCVTLSCAREPRKSQRQSSPGTPPSYTEAGIVPTGSANAAPLAPGRIASIYGENLGPAEACHGIADASARETPNPSRRNQTAIESQVFPASLCETEVRIGGVPAGLLYVSSQQINFRVPQSIPVIGQTEVLVIHRGVPGPVISVRLSESAPETSAAEAAEEMWAALQRIPWEQRYSPARNGGACQAQPAHPTHAAGGLNGHAYYCADRNANIVTESLYYPVNPPSPEVLLLRADIRPADSYLEWSSEVEQRLARRLTESFGPGSLPDRVYEIGAMPPHPGLFWRTGKLTLFLHHNSSYLAPAGLRTGVQLIAVREEILAQRLPATAPAPPSFVYGQELEELLTGRYFAEPAQPARSEPDRRVADHRTRAALVQLLESRDGEPSERAAVLVAADDLAVRLGGLLIARSIQDGSEVLTQVSDAPGIRAKLARLGVRYQRIGHYSGALEYDRGLLQRAWTEYPGTIWGQRAFLLLQELGCETGQFPCPGPNCFRSVIAEGEKFLEEYPDSSVRLEQIRNLAAANETWWSLSLAQPGDVTAEGAQVTPGSAERARRRAIELYERLLREAAGTPEARAAEIALPRLKLKLDTGRRTFFCFSC
jgi:uncharacterized protein (TIGR03437 family)